MEYTTVFDFWFSELTEDDWYTGRERIDQLLQERFFDVHKAVRQNECHHWRATPKGSLAEILVLDQFSRNLFRGTAGAFAYDGHALALAQVAIEKGFDQQVSEREKPFFYMPYMHSESPVIHETALQLFTDLGSEEHLKFEKIHKDIIDQFGRYPHRNRQLHRESTQEEIDYLAEQQYDFFKS